MKKILVLGPGCPNCTRLADMTERVARELGIEFELHKVTEISQITAFGVMATAAPGRLRMTIAITTPITAKAVRKLLIRSLKMTCWALNIKGMMPV